MDVSDWKKFFTRYKLKDYVTEHPRFLRSSMWGDNDHEGCVLDLVEYLSSINQSALVYLVELECVQKELGDIDREILDVLHGKADPLIRALPHSLDQIEAVQSIVDLKKYIERIENSVPSDPNNAIGAAKDLLEATMKTILDQRGEIILIR